MVIICDKPFTLAADACAGTADACAGTADACAGTADACVSGLVLSDFQKWAIKAIQDGDHVLITAHTGSGKTLPAEFAIQYFTAPERAQKKKVIYASPIKALSNQKLYDMRRKFPHISFGILTGDCKDNPEADVLIMTTEILRNTLMNQKINAKKIDKEECTLPEHQGAACGCRGTGTGTGTPLPLLFHMDMETELAAVVFDEVHYINDAERGSVWEQAILLLPPQVQLIMLSATIDRPEAFAGWIETEKRQQAEQRGLLPLKQMYLAPTYTRIVPLTHYMWLSAHESTLKKAGKTPYEQKIEALRKTPVPIASSAGAFREDNYYKMKEVLDYLHTNRVYTKRQFVLNELLTYLKAQAMLPAICFVISRKHVEQAANEINFSLFEAESSLPALVAQECRHILASKLPNYKEYLELPEYLNIVQLLEKGIAIHHAGIIPVLREMVELLFEKGFIRLLLATETFAVGLNMPTKTVIFAGLTKFNGTGMRLLFPHEYTQMAGRAGRRGLDTVGHVFHCVNLFELPSVTEYRHLLTGPPQTLTSKFKVSFNMALSLMEAEQNLTTLMEQSMLAGDLRKEIGGYEKAAEKNQERLVQKQEQLALCRTPAAVLAEYAALTQQLTQLANSARKKVRLELNNLEATHHTLLKDLAKYVEVQTVHADQTKITQEKTETAQYMAGTLAALQRILSANGFTHDNAVHDVIVTAKGRVAAQLQEVHPLALADLYESTNQFAELTATDLAGLFSCFYPVAVSDEVRVHNVWAHNPWAPHLLREAILACGNSLEMYLKSEQAAFLNTGANYEMYYDLLPYVMQWCASDDEMACKEIIQNMKQQTGLFIGEFVKALLKVNAVALEFARIAELTLNMALLEKMRQIPSLTLKYIATSQSLYL